MNGAPVRVSVIIPCYNGADLLERAANSVLAQTETNLELLIVDDCSTDDTWAVAQAIAAQDPRVRPIRMPRNGGKPNAMNHATDLAQGEWIAVLDHDDWFAPDRLRRLIEAAGAAGVDMAADRYLDVDIRADVTMPSALPRLKAPLLDTDSYLAASDPTRGADFGMLKPVVRKSFLESHGIAYYPPALVGEDFHFLLDCFSAGGEAVLVEEGLYFYVQPFGTVSRQWAQAARKPYPYDLYLKIHDHYMARLGERLTVPQRRLMDRRRKGLKAMLAFTALRQAVKERSISKVLRAVVQAPPAFWSMLARRLKDRLMPSLRGA